MGGGNIAADGVAFQVALAAVSYNVYREPPQKVDLDRVVIDALRKYTMFVPLAGTHFDASFNHLGNYSSIYYTYMWDKVIAEDFFQQFDQKHLLSGEAPMRYRRMVLEPGGSVSANDLVKSFLGRPQDTKAFQQWLGEEFLTP